MKKRFLTWYAIIAFLLMSAAAFYIYISRKKFEIDQPPLDINDFGNRQKIQCFGVVQPRGGMVELLPKQEGVIVKMYAKENQTFRKGETLYVLDTGDLEDRKRILEADLRSLMAAKDYLLEMPRQEDVEVAEVELDIQEEELQRLELQKNRSAQLIEKNAVSVASNEDIEKLWMLQKHKVALAEKNLKKLKAGASQYTVAEAEAKIQSIANQIKAVERQIDDMSVKAPFDGIVLQVFQHEGEYVRLHNYNFDSEGAAPVTFGRTSIQVEADVPEYSISQLKKLKRGFAWRKGTRGILAHLTEPRIIPYVVPKKVMTGTVSEVVDVRIIKVVFDVDAKFQLYPGEQVNVFLELDELNN